MTKKGKSGSAKDKKQIEAIKEKIGVDKVFSVSEAIGLLQESSKAYGRRFNETVELAVNLGIDAKQSSQAVRGSVSLPAGSGKEVRVIVVTDDEKLQKEGLDAGAKLAGMEDVIKKIDEGFLDFDYCVATPNVMSKLAKVAKKLGPRGLMPNPKNGNITKDVAKAVAEAVKGKVSFKNDKNGTIHCGFGKINFSNDDLLANFSAVIASIKEAKPEGAKGKYLEKIYLATTMGPSVCVEI